MQNFLGAERKNGVLLFSVQSARKVFVACTFSKDMVKRQVMFMFFLQEVVTLRGLLALSGFSLNSQILALLGGFYESFVPLFCYSSFTERDVPHSDRSKSVELWK